MTCGFTLLSWSTARLVRKPCNYMVILLAIIGAMKIAEGALRFCPMKYAMQFRDIFALFPKPKRNEFEGLEEFEKFVNPS
jgi:Protein of unknown function (DUF2892)